MVFNKDLLNFDFLTNLFLVSTSDLEELFVYFSVLIWDFFFFFLQYATFCLKLLVKEFNSLAAL